MQPFTILVSEDPETGRQEETYVMNSVERMVDLMHLSDLQAWEAAQPKNNGTSSITSFVSAR